VSVEDELRALRSVVERQHSLIHELGAKLDKLAVDVKPKLLRRPAVAEMFGLTPGALGQHKHRKTKLWQTLLKIAVVGLDGGPAWRPADIQLHCRPWLGGEVAS
jgi:hypothetical protein